MKAIVKTKPAPGLERIDLPDPVPAPGEVKIRVAAASICGTDIHFNRWDDTAVTFQKKFGMSFPLIIGHECSGTVTEVGSAVAGIKPGDRVAFETHIPCGHCYQCQTGQGHNCPDMLIYGTSCQGSFSDFALAPAEVVFKLPDSVSFEEGALFEPAGVAMRAVEEAAIQPGDTVLVYGCGPIGLLAARILLVCGAAAVIAADIDEYRLDMARRIGCQTINPAKEDIRQRIADIAAARRGVDVALEMTGSPVVYETIFDLLRLEGRLVTVGHPGTPVLIDITRNVNFKGLSLKGVFGRRIWQTWWKLASLTAAGKIDLLGVVTHRFSFAEYQEAFDQVEKGAGKILFINQD